MADTPTKDAPNHTVQVIEHIVIQIPAGMSFDDLELRMDGTDNLLGFNFSVMADMLNYSGISPASVEHIPPDVFFSAVLNSWYAGHLERGGARNAVMDNLKAEAEFERAAQGFSHTPGHA